MPLFSNRNQVSSITKADLACAARDWIAAAHHYADALSRNSNRPEIWVQYGHALKESGRRLEAEAAYRRAIEAAPASADAHLQLAHLLKLQHRTDEAKTPYLRALALDPRLADARRGLAELGLGDAEIAAARDALPPLPPLRHGRPSRITRADRARELGHWEEAAGLYGEALDRTPHNAPIWVQYGHMQKMLGDLQAAESAYRQALAYDPRNADTHLQLGHALKDQGKLEAAQSAYLRAFALEPDQSAPPAELAALGWSSGRLTYMKGLMCIVSEMNSATPDDSANAKNEELAPPPRERVGSLDGVYGATVAGWIWDPRNPASNATVEFLINGKVVHEALGTTFRDDVKDAGFGSGFAGFEAALPITPDPDGVEVHARLAGTNWALDNSPTVVRQSRNITRWLQRSTRVVGDFGVRLRRRLDREAKGILSVVIPVYNTEAGWLREAIESIKDQWCSHWELVCVDNGSTETHVQEILAEYAAADNRIKIVTLPKNLKIAGGINAGLKASSGVIIALMDSDDYLEPDAVYKYLRAYNTTKADLLYCDELITGSDLASARSVAARSAYSWDYYLGHPYFVHMICISRDLLNIVGGWNELMLQSGDVDFVLRCQEHSRLVVHIPAVLYRWRTHPTSWGHQLKEHVTAATLAALNRHLGRTAPGAVATAGLSFNFYRIDFPDDRGKVLIIIPTKNRMQLLKTCIESVIMTTVAAEIDIVVVDHDSDDEETIRYLTEIRHTVLIVPYHGTFNYAKMNNEAVRAYQERNGILPPYILFLNNDIEAIEPGWLEHMRGLARRDDVGAVGATLLYPDDRIQHAGVVIGLNGPAEHAHKFAPFKSGNRRADGHLGSLICTREYSAVTAACMMTRSTVFEQVGGFDEQLAIGFNDTDYCLRVGSTGLKILNDAHAVLRHHESATRSKTGQIRHPEDTNFFTQRWRRIIEEGDPYYSPLFFGQIPDHKIERYASAAAKVRVKGGLKR